MSEKLLEEQKSFDEKIEKTIERTTGNTLEQMVPFLLSLWLNAVFVSTHGAYKWGCVYLAFRFVYPALFFAGLPYLLLSTIPGYVVIFNLLREVVAAAGV